MTTNKIGFLFPAFVNEYIGNEEDVLSKHSIEFRQLLHSASQIVDTELTDFNLQTNNFIEDELKSQYIAFIFSCTISNILKENNIEPDYIAGYSMGIYSSLYCCESITFKDGLNLILNAFNFISSSLNKTKFGMGTIVGLEYHDLDKLILQNTNNVEIINTNSIYNHVISGTYQEVDEILTYAKAEGALYTRLFRVSIPYHSKFMKTAAGNFKNYLTTIQIKKPKYKIISLIDQSIIKSKDHITNCLAGNINTKVNWMKSMAGMINSGTTTFLECGAGKSLYKIGKFIEGDFKVYPISKLDKFIEFRKSKMSFSS